MENKKDAEQKAQEIQILEQNLHNILLQKQAFQMELSETQSAKKEIEGSKEVFKIVGQLMIKSNAEKVSEDLTSKEKLLSLRVRSIEKQELEIANILEELKKER
ncbi:MAG: prefoldin subunit [Nanoarchaeota archaeon]|nr:prefoldin subunit [Nanoarchaeota archaeon]